MSNWINGKELMAYWDIEGFELFGCLKKGLQPHTQYGCKIINTDTLEHAPEQSLEWCVDRTRRDQAVHQAVYQVGPFKVRERLRKRFPPMSEQQILQESTKQYESQPLRPVNPPPHRMSFTLPDNGKSARRAIKFLLALKFRKDEASEFAQKHGYRIFNELRDGSFPEQTHTDSNFSGGKYEPWLDGEKVKNILNTDTHGLMHLTKQGEIVAHKENLDPLTVDDINFMTNDPGIYSSDWPMRGFDGFMFRKDEVLRFSESQGLGRYAKTNSLPRVDQVRSDVPSSGTLKKDKVAVTTSPENAQDYIFRFSDGAWEIVFNGRRLPPIIIDGT